MQLGAYVHGACHVEHRPWLCPRLQPFKSYSEKAHDSADEDTNTIVDAADFSFTGDTETPGLHCCVRFC